MAEQFTPGGFSNNNGKYPSTTVNTNSVSFFGKESMLLTKYSERNLTISFRNAVFGEDGKRTFPRPDGGDEKNSCYLSKESVATLIQKMEEFWIPTFKEYVDNWMTDNSFNKEVSIAVPVNKELNKFLELTSGIPGNSGYNPQLRLHFDVGSDRIPRESKVFTFDISPIFINYRPEKGEYERLDMTYPQLLIFYKVLTEYIRCLCMGTCQSTEVRYGKDFKNIKNTINQIAIKNGIEVQSNYTNGRSGYSFGNPTPSIGSTQPTSSQSNPIQEYNGDIGALLGTENPIF